MNESRCVDSLPLCVGCSTCWNQAPGSKGSLREKIVKNLPTDLPVKDLLHSQMTTRLTAAGSETECVWLPFSFLISTYLIDCSFPWDVVVSQHWEVFFPVYFESRQHIISAIIACQIEMNESTANIILNFATYNDALNHFLMPLFK